MKQSPSFITDILDSISDGVFTVDKKWDITSFNKAAERITGVGKNEALGRKCWEVFRSDACEHCCVLKQTMETGKSIVNRTVHIINSKGCKIPISVSTALLKDKRGNVKGGVETFRDLSEVEQLRKELLGRHTFHEIITADHRMKKIFDVLPAISRSEGPVLILGESGTGKELLAKAIHNLSERAGKPFIAVNCGALPDTLLESELFGYRKGAFTDARSDKPGRFELAEGGTVFLDEIGEMSKPLQVKLLRVLQDKVFEPLGATEAVKADVRIIAATNRDINTMVTQGDFRKDLYYRINTFTFQLPPLRERTTDIPLLLEHFLARLNSMHQKHITGFSGDALAALMRYEYPGNIRELENIVYHAFFLCTGNIIEKQHLPAYICNMTSLQSNKIETVEEFEAQRIREALIRNNFNRSKTAGELGVDPSTLWRKMKKFNIHEEKKQ